MTTIRRYVIHPPQLVGRLDQMQPGEEPAQYARRLISNYDAAMQELQRFLKYMMDAVDPAQKGEGIAGIVDGGVDHGSTSGLGDDDHPHYLKEKASGGLAAETPLHGHSGSAEAGTVNHGVLTGLADDDHPHYLKEKASGGVAAEIPDHTHAGATEGGTVDHGALTGLGDDDHPQYLTTFERFSTFVGPAGAIALTLWRAPFACTVLNVRGYRTGGTGATVNAQKNGASTHLASDLSLTSAGTWMDGGAVQNETYAAGDSLELLLQSVAGAPAEVVIQVDFRKG